MEKQKNISLVIAKFDEIKHQLNERVDVPFLARLVPWAIGTGIIASNLLSAYASKPF